MRLIIASNNAHKVKEIKEILGGYFSDIQTLREAGLDIDVVEDGVTFEENALKKATQVLAAAPWADAALSDDSGLMVDALDGAPGSIAPATQGAPAMTTRPITASFWQIWSRCRRRPGAANLSAPWLWPGGVGSPWWFGER